jgi:hypothetical protein
MQATIFYVDDTKTTRDERWVAGRGKLLPGDRYAEVNQVDLPGTDDNTPIALCEAIFAQYQAIDGPVFGADDKPIRSMSVGDLIVIEDGLFICQGVGFKLINGWNPTK